MEDSRIIDLYWQRNESAISATQEKYGRYCYSIAYHILHNKEDSDESVNDSWLGAWDTMPPHRPEILSVFLGKITRRISLKKWRTKTAIKRGGGELEIALEELEFCIPADKSMEDELEIKELAEIIDDFLGSISDMERRVFLCRYWYFDSIKSIANRFSFSQSKVKMMLKRTRDKLLIRLKEEDIWI